MPWPTLRLRCPAQFAGQKASWCPSRSLLARPRRGSRRYGRAGRQSQGTLATSVQGFLPVTWLQALAASRSPASKPARLGACSLSHLIMQVALQSPKNPEQCTNKAQVTRHQLLAERQMLSRFSGCRRTSQAGSQRKASKEREPLWHTGSEGRAYMGVSTNQESECRPQVLGL